MNTDSFQTALRTHFMFSLCVCTYRVSPASFRIILQLLGELDLEMSMWFVYLFEDVVAILNESTRRLFFIYLKYFLVIMSVLIEKIFSFPLFLFPGEGFILSSLAVSD